MKALVKSKAETGLWMKNVPMPKIGINDVLVKVHRTAICGTDIHIYNWDNWAQKTIPTPMTIGHEFVGEIVDIGSNVIDFHEGQLVSGEGHIVCGRCRNCMAGKRHFCSHTSGIGVNRTGAFAEYIALPMSNIWVHRDDTDKDIAAIFDPFGNATHTALQWPLLGEDILITGAGPIGCMAVAVCKHAGARNIVVTDINPYRMQLAKQMGATRIVDPREENLVDIQKELGMVEGFDVGLEMSGSPSALNDMIANMNHGGKISMLGIPSDQTQIDWNRVIFSMITLKGIYGREMYDTWYKMSMMVHSGIDLSPIITHRMHYTEFQNGFDIMLSGESGKVILNWED